MIILINGHTYKMGKNEFKGFIKELKKKFKGKNIILGIEKDGILECRKDEFETPTELLDEVQRWISKKYKVYYVRKLIWEG